MTNREAPSKSSFAVCLALILFLAPGCGGGSGGGGTSQEPAPQPTPVQPTDPGPSDPTDPSDPGEPACDQSFDSTYDAIQSIVFEDRGCTAEACHGSATSGGLDLRAGASYANLVEVPATASDLARVYPGTKERSFLWWKLLAAVDDSVQIAGSPMPLGTSPLGETELELLRLWIQGGAPEAGTVLGTDDLLAGCLPDPEPIIIEPLAAPEPGEGVQLVMPPWDLVASSENEICFATYYDFSDQVPEEFKTPDGLFFYTEAYEIRQDPSSHHLLIQTPVAAFGGNIPGPDAVQGWACMGGPSDGAACDPLDSSSCGDGFCATPIEQSSGCTGYVHAPDVTPVTFSGTQQAQFLAENYPGVYNVVPIRGLVFWNSHAFNLTTKDTKMNARANYRFARELRYPAQYFGGGNNSFGIPRLLREGAEPYTEKVMCGETVLPQGARLTGLNSHTHKRGKRFWYELSDGSVLYESLVYNDPVQLYFDPPIAFDSEARDERTIKYCSLYNNGVDENGAPDPETVTRASRIPYGVRFEGSDSPIGLCEPTRCVNPGMYDVDCDDGIPNQAGNDAACDTSPGSGDGFCDACRIMGGVTTENEMFGPAIEYFVQD